MISTFIAEPFAAPLNEEFVQPVVSRQPSEASNSGEAWVLLPMYEQIDIRSMSSVTISIEMFMKGLLEVYESNPSAAGYDGPNDSFRGAAGVDQEPRVLSRVSARYAPAKRTNSTVRIR